MEKKKSKPAIFLDRDGVLMEDFGYVYKPEDVSIFADVPHGLKDLKAKGYLLVVVTNQSGVARNYFTLEDVELCHDELDRQLNQHGIQLDGYFICPHHPKGVADAYTFTCDCRKPFPGLIDRACDEFEIDLERSYIIGDKASDIECGLARGVKGIQILNDQYPVHDKPDFTAKTFKEACEYILNRT